MISDAFGWNFLGFIGFAFSMGFLCYLILGPEEFKLALIGDVTLLKNLLPRIIVALSVAALLWVLLPHDQISRLVGKDSGLRGLLIAAAAGTVTPGGPSSAYAFLAVLASSGADRGALVAYITAWATLGLQRVLVWDVPFMGEEFSIVRLMVSLPLPIIAGLIARKLPFSMTLRGPKITERLL